MNSQSLAQFDGPIGGECVLAPLSKPAFIGESKSGIDWHCYKCGTLLAASIGARQLLDILIRCYSCNEFGELPRRSPGEPVGPGSVVTSPGMSLLTDSINLWSPVAMLSERAVRAYDFEVGRTDQSRIMPVHDSAIINEKTLRDLAQGAIDLLGVEYERLAASDRRGLSSPTPPPRRHRIIELITRAQDMADLHARNLSRPLAPADGALLTELMAVVALFDRWKNHPAYSQLLATLKSDVDVPHTIMTLAVASYFADAGNGVGIVHEDGDGRIPDIRILAIGQQRAEIEIKAPSVLYGPFSTDPSDLAIDKTITRLVKSSASAKKGQFDTSQPGLLVICGFHFSPSLMPKLVTTARKVLKGQMGRKGHLAGIAFFDLASLDVRLGGGNSMIMSNLNREFVPHSSYSGPISLNLNPPQVTVSTGQLGSL